MIWTAMPKVAWVGRARTLAFCVLAVLVATTIGMVLAAKPAHAATFTVNSLADAGDVSKGAGTCDTGERIDIGGQTEPECTLRAAIEEANANGEGDTIDFRSRFSGTINLTLGSLPTIENDALGDDLSIQGPGANNIAVSGNNASRLFDIGFDANVTISGLTISDGRAQVGPGIFNTGGTITLTNTTVSGNSATRFGGGIYNNGSGGTITLTNSIVSGNSAAEGGGGIVNDSGSVTAGTLTLTNSTVSGNKANGGNGGGILNAGMLTLDRSTVSGNSATSVGGGIYSNISIPGSSHKTTVTNSTISGNTASTGGGGIYNANGRTAIEHSTITNNTASLSSGSGVASNAQSTTSTSVLATIISANPGTDVVFVGGPTNTFSSKDFNLIGDGNATAAFNQPGDQSGVANPGLGSLANNGGPTLTHAVQPGSPAIDQVLSCPPPATDQRGVARPKDADEDGNAFCDIGAYERNDLSPPKVTTTVPTDGKTGVRRNANLTATFSETMDRSTLTTSTFKLFKVNADNTTTQITAVAVSSTTDGFKATLNPDSRLAKNTEYKAVVTTAAKDRAGNRLDQNRTQPNNQPKEWIFTTGSS